MKKEENGEKMIIKLADRIIEIHNMYSYIEEYCKDYIYNSSDCRQISFSVNVTQEDIDFERTKSRAEDIKEGMFL